MEELRNFKKGKLGVYIIKNKDIEDFACRQLRNYDENYFKHPHALDIDDFSEFYLKKNINFKKLSLDGNILGTTSLHPGFLPVITDDGKASLIEFNAGDICIDEEACKNDQRFRFTLAHELWHSQFDLNVSEDVLLQRKKIVYYRCDINIQFKTIKTDYEWMEYHANMYATYLLMPAAFIRKLFKLYYDELFRQNNKRISCKKPKRTWALIAKIAQDLNVSKQAIAIRLRELSLISNEVYSSLNIKSVQ